MNLGTPKTRYGSQNHCAIQFFNTELNNGKLQCKECGVWISAKKASNLTAHLLVVHKDKFSDMFGISLFNTNNIIGYERLHFIQCCAEAVSINAWSFNQLNHSSFLKLNSKKLEKFAKAGVPVNLKNPHEIKSYVTHLAKEIKKCIIENVRGKYVCIMADIATRRNRSILGICI